MKCWIAVKKQPPPPAKKKKHSNLECFILNIFNMK